MASRIRKTFTVYDGDESRTMALIGRDAWMLGELIHAGKRGVTSLENPAPRMSHYVWKLRHTYGIDIASIEEAHGGPYSGTHVRYVLRQRIEFAGEDVELSRPTDAPSLTVSP